ncbi:MAG TPA: hypothetical protein VK034_17385 [Enhygromyxa sp.]|nr:hypothetical protein [Enhygromyxa sp.]
MILMLSACGPGRVGSSGASSDDTGSTEDSSSPESSGSESSEPNPTTADTVEPETETDDDGPDTGFVPESEFPCGGGFWCPASCDPFSQDCPEGEKCTPYASTGETWDAVKCVPVLGDLGPGEPCTYEGRVGAIDDCDISSMCYGGICQPFCTGTADSPICPDDHGCSYHPLTLCLERCDPLAQDCATGSCYWNADDFLCHPSGELAIGEPCGLTVNDCTAGSVCFEGSSLPSCRGSSCCTPYCNLDQPDCASLPGTACVSWYGPGQAPPGLELVGVCLSP